MVAANSTFDPPPVQPAPLAWSFAGIDGKSYLGVVAKRAYRIDPQRRAAPIGELPVSAAMEAASGWGPDPQPGHAAEADVLALMKPVTDVLLTGSAHARRGPTPMVDTGLRVGPVARSVRVWGPRTIEGGPGAPSFSAAEPFETLPITWGEALGGAAYAGPGEGRRSLHVGYPRNPFGRGFRGLPPGAGATRTQPNRDEPAPAVPRIEDPYEPVRPEHLQPIPFERWSQLPLPAGYGPIHSMVFPRSAFYLRSAPDRALGRPREVDLGAIREEDLWFEGTRAPHPRVYNAAAPGLATARLSGRERVHLLNLHSLWHDLTFDLPDDVPRLFVEVPGVGTRELAATLATVWIEPERDRVVLTWAGRMEVAWPYPEEDTQRMCPRVTWARQA